MTTNPPLTRETLLRIVDAALKPDSSSGHSDVDLDEQSIQRIINQLSLYRSSATVQRDPHSDPAPPPIPLADVAAYVDGTLQNPRSQQQITLSAVTDPGLLMEIVIARRDVPKSASVAPRNVSETASAMGSDLRSRLLQLHAPAAPSDTALSQPTPMPLLIETESETSSAPTSSASRKSDVRSIVGWIIAVAAIFLVAGGIWTFVSNRPEAPEMVELPDVAGPLEPSEQDIESRTHHDVAPMLAEAPESSTDGTSSADAGAKPVPERIDRAPGTSIAMEPIREEPSEETPAESLEAPMDAVPEVGSDAAMVANSSDPSTRTDDPADPEPVSLVATWSEIDGVLIRSDPLIDGVTSMSAVAAMEGISVGSSFKLASRSSDIQLRLRTLPLCRAVAEIAGGGQLVLAGDTRVEASFGGMLDLQHGSIALLNLKRPSAIRIGGLRGKSISLASHQGGSIVIRRTTTGMEIDAVDQPVRINGESFDNMTVRVDDSTMLAQPAGQAPAKLPKWTKQRVDRIELGRNVLAQLSASPDIRTSLAQALRTEKDTDAANTLRAWLIESSSESLLRLISAGDPITREMALNQLARVTPDNPKNAVLWRGLVARTRNPRTLVTMRAFFADLWSNQRPVAVRREQLLRMLQSSDPLSRVTADYLLRSFYGSGPPFDLNSTAQARTRAASIWRTISSRSDRQ